MRHESKKLLWDVSEACSDIERITEPLTYDQYLAQKDTRRLVERYLETVGEALRGLERTEAEQAERFADLRRWVDLRNFVAHRYGSIDNQIIWRVSREFVPD
jgi:uncharacterized protein with HEPN domain